MPITTLVVLAAVVAVAAAMRGTWSPCGLSMLSTITPMTERSRGHRYGVTAAWFIAGAALGGACLGGAAALGALAVHAAHLPVRARYAVAAVAAAVCIASDLRLFGVALPLHPRQVDETWLARYRAWVYGGGFGWQIGSGFATYIMSAAVYLTVCLAVLTGRPLVALALGVGFGAARGSAVLLTARASSLEALAGVHRRLARLEPASRAAAVAVQVAAGVTLAAVALGGPVVAVSLAAAALGVVVAALVNRRAAVPA